MQEQNKSACTLEEIAEKRRLAQERLKKTKASAQSSNSTSSAGTSTRTFYGNGQSPLANTLNKYESKIKQQPTHSYSNRISSQPYPRNGNAQRTSANNDQQKTAPLFMNVVTCTCTCIMITPKRFQVIQKGYHMKLIDVFKTIPTRSYGKI